MTTYYEVQVATPEQFTDGVWRPMIIAASGEEEALTLVNNWLDKAKAHKANLISK